MKVLVEKIKECQPNGKSNNSLLFYEFFIFKIHPWFVGPNLYFYL
jgi:hypothetical protein